MLNDRGVRRPALVPVQRDGPIFVHAATFCDGRNRFEGRALEAKALELEDFQHGGGREILTFPQIDPDDEADRPGVRSFMAVLDENGFRTSEKYIHSLRIRYGYLGVGRGLMGAGVSRDAPSESGMQRPGALLR